MHEMQAIEVDDPDTCLAIKQASCTKVPEWIDVLFGVETP